MTKEPIEKENFLGVVLKPVVKDQKDCQAPQQAKQMLKVNLIELNKVKVRLVTYFKILRL